MPHLYITENFFLGFFSLIEGLARHGLSHTYAPTASRAEILEHMPEADVLLVRSDTQVNAELLDAAPKLKLVLRLGAGMENIDVHACMNRGIAVRNTKGTNALAVAEQTLGMLLSLMNNLHHAHHELQQGIYSREANRAEQLAGKTVGIIGYGYTGRAVAKALSGMGVTTLAYDKYRQHYADEHAQEASLARIQAEAHIITLHVPHTPETHHLVDEAFINRCNQLLYLLNLSRGKVCAVQALHAALMNHKLTGLALDVHEYEPLFTGQAAEDASYTQAYQELLQHPGFIATPHIGGWSFQSEAEQNNRIVHYLYSFMGLPYLGQLPQDLDPTTPPE